MLKTAITLLFIQGMARPENMELTLKDSAECEKSKSSNEKQKKKKTTKKEQTQQQHLKPQPLQVPQHTVPSEKCSREFFWTTYIVIYIYIRENIFSLK